LIDIEIPEVRGAPVFAKFSRGEDGRDYVEIKSVGMTDTSVQKVRPEHMARFRVEWDAYCDGRPMSKRPGTPLTELVESQQAETFIARNVHNLEELAVLNDLQCQGLGHGTMSLRKKAQELLVKQQMDARDRVATAMAGVGSRPANDTEIEGIKAAVTEQGKQLAALTSALTQLVGAINKPKRGRPRKDKNGSGNAA
jgi:hypothetical protein